MAVWDLLCTNDYAKKDEEEKEKYITILYYVTVLAKTRLVRTKTEFNFITTVYRHTQYLSIPSVSSVKC